MLRMHLQEDSDTELLQYEKLKELRYDTRCHAIAFAPETNLLTLPKAVVFCAVGADFRLRIYRSDLCEADTLQCLDNHDAHSDYVNDVAWEPNSGKYLASVSDDHSCKIRSAADNYSTHTVFRFKSAAMSVRWHRDDADKLMVAEKRGTIHLYNIVARQIILSIETTKQPLMCADWFARNRCLIVAIAAGEIIAFDTRYPQ